MKKTSSGRGSWVTAPSMSGQRYPTYRIRQTVGRLPALHWPRIGQLVLDRAFAAGIGAAARNRRSRRSFRRRAGVGAALPSLGAAAGLGLGLLVGDWVGGRGRQRRAAALGALSSVPVVAAAVRGGGTRLGMARGSSSPACSSPRSRSFRASATRRRSPLPAPRRTACAGAPPAATPACASSPRTDGQRRRPRRDRRADAVGLRGRVESRRRSRSCAPRARDLPPRGLDVSVADAGLPLVDRDRRPPGRPPDPAPRLVRPRRAAARRVRLLVRARSSPPGRAVAPSTRSST